MKYLMRDLSIGVLALTLSGLSQAAGETGEVNVTQVKVSANFTQVIFDNAGLNPDSCGGSTSVIVESTNPAKKEIYASAMAALNARLPAYFDVDGCSTLAGSSSSPVVTAITVGAQ